MNPVVAEWIAKAEADRRTGVREYSAHPDPNYDDACFHAQQCIEKLMKAVLIRRGRVPPHTHDLACLGDLVSQACPGWAASEPDLRRLTQGAVRFRYPGRSAAEEDAREALAACERTRTGLLPLL